MSKANDMNTRKSVSVSEHTPTLDMGKELANIATRIAEDGCQCSDDVLCKEHVVLSRTLRAVNEYEQNKNALRSALDDSAQFALEVKHLKDAHEELLQFAKNVEAYLTGLGISRDDIECALLSHAKQTIANARK